MTSYHKMASKYRCGRKKNQIKVCVLSKRRWRNVSFLKLAIKLHMTFFFLYFCVRSLLFFCLLPFSNVGFSRRFQVVNKFYDLKVQNMIECVHVKCREKKNGRCKRARDIESVVIHVRQISQHPTPKIHYYRRMVDNQCTDFHNFRSKLIFRVIKRLKHEL